MLESDHETGDTGLSWALANTAGAQAYRPCRRGGRVAEGGGLL